MHRRFEGPRRWRVGVLVSIATLGSMLAVVAGPGSAGAASNKPFGVVICAPGQSCPPGSPPVVSPGSAPGTTPVPASITAVLTDETTKGAGLTIGSANLTAPAGVSIVSASLGGTTIGACTDTKHETTSCFTDSVLELRGLNVPPGGSVEVTIGIDTPPPPSSCTTATPCKWSVTAKQSNDYNGAGNDLNLDPGSSQLGIVLSSEATCTSAKKSNSCSTTLADGGATGSSGGSVSITTSATGTSSGIFYESIDYGQHLDADNECSGIDSLHDEYLSGSALNGSNARSFTVTITTTDYPGYQAELCATSSQPFTAKYLPGSEGTEGTETTLGPEVSATGDSSDSDKWWCPWGPWGPWGLWGNWCDSGHGGDGGSTATLGPAVPVTQPDGTPGYAGLLPDCKGGAAPTVNCDTQPGVVSRSTSPDGTVHTIVASFPAGFDATLRN